MSSNPLSKRDVPARSPCSDARLTTEVELDFRDELGRRKAFSAVSFFCDREVVEIRGSCLALLTTKLVELIDMAPEPRIEAAANDIADGDGITFTAGKGGIASTLFSLAMLTGRAGLELALGSSSSENRTRLDRRRGAGGCSLMDDLGEGPSVYLTLTPNSSAEGICARRGDRAGSDAESEGVRDGFRRMDWGRWKLSEG